MGKAYSGIRHLALAGFVMLSTVANGAAQTILRMDNADCIGGLGNLGKVANIEIIPATTPRRVVGKCDAQSVRVVVERAGVTLDIKRIKWNRNGLSSLAEGQLPQQLRLELQGVSVLESPADDPVWAYLADYTGFGRTFDAGLAYVFEPDTGVLELTGASIGFRNGNTVKLSARLHGVVPGFPKNPEMGVFPLIVDDLLLAVSNGGARKRPLTELGIAVLKKNIPNGDIGQFRSLATLYIANELSGILDRDGLAAAQRLVSDLPDPKGDLRLRLVADKGYPVLRFGLLQAGEKLSRMLDGVSVEFAYGPDLFTPVN
ncbi:hypothetical protein [Profundibacter sp.]